MGSLIEITSLANVGICDFKESMKSLSCISVLLNFQYALPLMFSETGHSVSVIAEWSDCTDGIIPTAFIFS